MMVRRVGLNHIVTTILSILLSSPSSDEKEAAEQGSKQEKREKEEEEEVEERWTAGDWHWEMQLRREGWCRRGWRCCAGGRGSPAGRRRRKPSNAGGTFPLQEGGAVREEEVARGWTAPATTGGRSTGRVTL